MKRSSILLFALASLLALSGTLWGQAELLYQKPPEIQGKTWFNTKKALTLKKLKRKKKVVIIEFMITTCPHCVPVVPRMKEIHEKYSKEDVVLIAITHEDAKKVAAWVKKENIPYPVLSDPDTKSADAYSNRIAPYIYIIAKNGLVCWQNSAQALDDDELDIAFAGARATKKKK